MSKSKIVQSARTSDRAALAERTHTDPDLSHLYGDQIDRVAMRAYRLARVRRELARKGLAGVVLFDPVNIRYATGARNMAVWTLHNPARYAFIATDGPVILFDYHGSRHLAGSVETIDEIRPAISWFYFAAGERTPERARTWAAEIADLVRQHGGGSRTLAADSVRPEGVVALEGFGIDIAAGDAVLEQARSIKGPEEIAAMRISLEACETGMAAMHKVLVPGITENALWAELHRSNIVLGGEWIETRLLSSGPRTNPWFQECSDRPIRERDLVAFDTDLIGPYGYCADISRTWVVGGQPTRRQRELHALAREQIEYNIEILGPGLSLREVAEHAWSIPDAYESQRYSVIAHGVGLCDEWPSIFHRQDYEESGYEGTLRPNMTLSVESYIGAVGGHEGVKLEEQVMITENGAERLSCYPLEM